MKRLLCMLAAFALCAGVLAAPKPSPKSPTTPVPSESVYRLSVTLTDQHGKRFDWSQRRGKAVEKQLTPRERERLGILLISMDPGRDTPAALMSVATKRKLDHARWTLASPAQADVRKIAGVLGIRYRALADGEFNHTSALVLLDSEGRILTRTEQMGAKVDPEFMAQVRRAVE